jgi:hypothetical protein
MIMLPYYGVTRHDEKLAAIEGGYIGKQAKLMYQLDWRLLTATMAAVDVRAKEPR